MTANLQEQYVDPKTGKLTLAGIKLLQDLIKRVVLLETGAPP